MISRLQFTLTGTWLDIEGAVCCVYDRTVQSAQQSHKDRKHLLSMYTDNMDLQKLKLKRVPCKQANQYLSDMLQHTYDGHTSMVSHKCFHMSGNCHHNTTDHMRHNYIKYFIQQSAPFSGTGDAHMTSDWYTLFRITPQPHTEALVPYAHTDTYEH